MKTLEQILKTKHKFRNGSECVPDFRISVQKEAETGVKIMIHPLGIRENVFNFIVKDNNLEPV